MKKHLALKVDVDTLRGTVEGVPNLLRLFDKLNIRATFLFSLGPDHTGRAIKRVFRPGFFAKVQRTSVVEHYGIKTLLYGTVLPGPDIGKTCAGILRDTRCAGHEVGIHTWDHVLWQDKVRGKNAEWTRRQMQQAYERFTEIFGSAPQTHGAAGWQMNDHALEQLDDWGMAYASDGRGCEPFRPVIEGRSLRCVQLPTTLPTLDELIGVDDMNDQAAAQHLLRQTARIETAQVFTLHTELEGAKLQPAFETLLSGWMQQGFTLSSLKDYYTAAVAPRLATLPTARAGWGSVPGRSGELIVQM